jgi:NAD(P)-dependent dehydrogenase (short-subunit alcohol dehydrogenase family)
MAAAAALAGAGADVILIARTAAEIEGVAEALRAKGLSARAQVLDVTDSAAVRRFVERSGPFRILVNNAGTNRPALLTETTDQDIADVLNLNVTAALVMAREVARGLQAARLTGSIIQMSSQMGHVGGPKRSVYCASKHALEGMTKALAWEWGRDGIRVNSICPTFIRTAMTHRQFEDPGFHDTVLSKIALGRLGELTDVMGAIVFLASDAANLVTGSALMVDGGWTAA